MLVSGVPDPAYADRPVDLRVNVPSGVLAIGDGSTGGAPLAGIDFGLPTSGVVSRTVSPKGIVGASLTAMQHEFPAYTRISWDEASLGAQLLGAVSNVVDEHFRERWLWDAQQTVAKYPCYEQGVVQEWNFRGDEDLDGTQRVEARLGSRWFELPVAASEKVFWEAPPTRLETTSAEVSAAPLLPWTTVGSRGLVPLLSGVKLPFHENVLLSVRGGGDFFVDQPDGSRRNGYVELRGRVAHVDLGAAADAVERIPVVGNFPLWSTRRWQWLDEVVAFGIDPAAEISLSVFGFNGRFQPDAMTRIYPSQRDVGPSASFWQAVDGTTTFADLGTSAAAPVPSGSFFLVQSAIELASVSGLEVRYDVKDFLRVVKPDGSDVPNVVDTALVPHSRWLLALDAASTVWVVPLEKPLLNMSAFPETVVSPVRIEAAYPRNPVETPDAFSVRLDSVQVFATAVIEKYRWSVHHDGVHSLLALDGTTTPFDWRSGWTFAGPEGIARIPSAVYPISGAAGQYTFELETLDDNARSARTYTAIDVPVVQAVAGLPLRGLAAAPSGIDVDSHGRPWVGDGRTAVRLVMRTDVGFWDVARRMFLTREPYDEVRRID
jgi:hypothetical protein